MEAQATIQPAPAQSRGVDVDVKLTQADAQLLATQGYTFCVRYLGRGAPKAGDLDEQEVHIILQAGLALMAVQHVTPGWWTPDAALGTEYGSTAGSNALAAGLPPGLNLWLDLESVVVGCTADDVLDYCRNWYTAVSDASYLPGLYVGANCGLNEAQLYSLPFQHYWKSLSDVPAIPTRGYQMVQSRGPVGAVPPCDVNVTSVDQLGGVPMWLRAAPAA